MPILLLYGLDDRSPDFEVVATQELVQEVSEALCSRGWQVQPVMVVNDVAAALRPFCPSEWVVLNLCEGAPTQAFYYARVAQILADLGYRFTGSDAVSLEKTQFKRIIKQLLDQNDIPTPRWGVFEQADRIKFDIFPAIVKPANEHCSYGITRQSVVMNLAEAQQQSTALFAQFGGQPVLIEEFLDSDEYNVSLWGMQQPAVLGISTMTYGAFDDIHDRLCTFDAKWTPESEAYQRIPAICPAPLTPELKAEIERVSLAAYRAVGCRHYGRVDLRLKHGSPLVLDINTNCDLSSSGGFANAARAAGLTYAHMLEKLVQLAKNDLR
ncbi:MAG: hypothetical protein KIH69_014855 [Anaerolineae bacterium]|nr:hypothetical protein [Anaerolineae bacterium]